jgi:hypothetical protein
LIKKIEGTLLEALLSARQQAERKDGHILIDRHPQNFESMIDSIADNFRIYTDFADERK